MSPRERPGGAEPKLMADENTGLDGVQPPDWSLPSKDDLETYRILFELFDRDKSSFIDADDLRSIAVKL